MTARQNLIEAAARAFFSNNEAIFPSYRRYPRHEDALCYAAEEQFGAGSPEHEYFLAATDRAYDNTLRAVERLCEKQLVFFTSWDFGPDPIIIEPPPTDEDTAPFEPKIIDYIQPMRKEPVELPPRIVIPLADGQMLKGATGIEHPAFQYLWDTTL